MKSGESPGGADFNATAASNNQAAASLGQQVETAQEAVELNRYIDGCFSNLPLSSSDKDLPILPIDPPTPKSRPKYFFSFKKKSPKKF